MANCLYNDSDAPSEAVSMFGPGRVSTDQEDTISNEMKAWYHPLDVDLSTMNTQDGNHLNVWPSPPISINDANYSSPFDTSSLPATWPAQDPTKISSGSYQEVSQTLEAHAYREEFCDTPQEQCPCPTPTSTSSSSLTTMIDTPSALSSPATSTEMNGPEGLSQPSSQKMKRIPFELDPQEPPPLMYLSPPPILHVAVGTGTAALCRR